MRKELYDDARRALEEFERKNHLELLIAAAGGSRSIGTDAADSDDDIYVVYDDKNVTLPFKVHYSAEMSFEERHFITCGSQVMKEAVAAYRSRPRKYPTCLYRTTEQAQRDHALDMYHRDDYPRSLIFYTFLGDDVWFFHRPPAEVYAMFRDGLYMADVLDFYYTKAHGNYEHFIKERERVNTRKYITIIQQLLYCRYIYQRREIPPMNVRALLDVFKQELSREEHRQMLEIYRTNRESLLPKTEGAVPASETINRFIETWLDVLAADMDKFDQRFELREM